MHRNEYMSKFEFWTEIEKITQETFLCNSFSKKIDTETVDPYYHLLTFHS